MQSNTVLEPPYQDTLKGDEFRLICLTDSAEEQYPVYLELETYARDSCSEYETTSYNWADENDDNKFCRPVYVGPYWDVLLQTNNCWSMLRFLRPYRRIRHSWVDAVCINQKNMAEREEQVSIMGLIYQNCLRTVLYLGEDVVGVRTGECRKRSQFHVLAGKPLLAEGTKQSADSGPSLKDLLQLRYFTRVWVIQELPLCKGQITS